jgi:small nuclear ribonucleoprotein (snRNP)-like protein
MGSAKLSALLQHKVKGRLADGRSFVGYLLAFDKHMNLVLAEAEEQRLVGGRRAAAEGTPATEGGAKAPRKLQKRMLGLVILRGDMIVAVSLEVGGSLPVSCCPPLLLAHPSFSLYTAKLLRHKHKERKQYRVRRLRARASPRPWWRAAALGPPRPPAGAWQTLAWAPSRPARPA